MDNERNIFDFVYRIFALFGFTIMFVAIAAVLCSEDGSEVSTLFSLEDRGVAINTIIEFFAFSIVNTSLEFIFFTDKIIKNRSIVFRTVSTVSCIIIASIFFIAKFKWFPVDNYRSWIAFLITFIICFIVSAVLSTIKTNMEDKKLAQGLEKLKEGDKAENVGN